VNMLIKEDKNLDYNYSFSFEFDYNIVDYCKALKQKVGFKRFSFFDGKWRFKDIDIAVFLKDRYPEIVIDDSVKATYDLAQYLSKDAVLVQENAKRLKQTLTSNLKIEGIKGELFPYQKVGVEFFINNNGKAILADTMGLGKTLMSLAYLAHNNIPKTLVICPATVKYNWKNEVSKWTKLKPYIINSNIEEKEIIRNLEKYNVFLINYDIIKKFFSFLIKVNWDMVIMDEFHYIKNLRAARTKLSMTIAKKSKKLLLLSGTPFLSRPIELFNGLHLMNSVEWHDYYSYGTRYCDAHRDRFGWNDRGASNIPELQERINPYFLRRNKDEVLPDLPKKMFVNYPVMLESEIKSQYRLAEEEFGRYLMEVKNKTDKETRKTMQAEKLAKLGALRMLTTQGKIKAAKEIIEGIIDGGEKVVVFSCYNDPLEKLHQDFKKESVLLTGKIDAKERGSIIKKFQEDKKCKIFFGGIKSAGVGITLTSATNVLFIDYSWCPADHTQAIDRIHRIGSTSNHITIYQLYSKGTVDEYMHKLLEKKQLLFDQLIEGRSSEYEKNYTSSIIKAIERKEKKRQASHS
jgi:SWI/SNF-related matrix-associated actin-dependent regulator of chromatin subfamily A-like protein 1